MPKQVCLLNYKKGGRPFWNQFFLAPIHDASGVVEYYLGIQSDVTEEVESARLARTHLEGQSQSRHASSSAGASRKCLEPTWCATVSASPPFQCGSNPG